MWLNRTNERVVHIYVWNEWTGYLPSTIACLPPHLLVCQSLCSDLFVYACVCTWLFVVFIYTSLLLFECVCVSDCNCLLVLLSRYHMRFIKTFKIPCIGLWCVFFSFYRCILAFVIKQKVNIVVRSAFFFFSFKNFVFLCSCLTYNI